MRSGLSTASRIAAPARGSGSASICAGFCEAMGAELDLDATPGGGLTARRGAATPPMTHVLVVEDDPSLRRSLTLNLTARGYSVDDTGNGEDTSSSPAGGYRTFCSWTSGCRACPDWK